jgi:peptide/nickel transport system substrate-binding protein
MIFDLLVYEDPVTLKIIPRTAQSFTTSDNGTTWTLKLRPNIQFTDGTPYDAAAVQFNWQREADATRNPRPTGYGTASAIATMDVIDPLTLKITLKAQDTAWDHRVAQQMAWIGSPTALKNNPTGFATKPVGAGPFILQNWQRDTQYTFVKNPNYWQKGKPYLDGVNIKLVLDDSARYNTLKSGEADISYQFDPGPVTQAKADGFKINQMQIPGGGWSFAMNNTRAPFNDVRVRNAIDMVLNRQQFNQIRRGNNPAALMTTVDSPGSPYYDPSIKLPKTNVAAAQKLIDAYIAENGGKPINITYTVFNNWLLQDAQVTQQQIQQLKNVTVTLEPLSSADVITRFSTGQFQAVIYAPRWNEPALDFVSYFLSTSPLNYYKYSNPQVDTILNQLKTTTDQKTKIKLVHDAEQIILKDSPIAWYTRYPSYTELSKKVQGYKTIFDQIPFMEDVWLKKSA